MVWLFNVTPWYDPKPTLNTTEILSVNVESKMLIAVCLILEEAIDLGL
jgi:hypothetical protein